MASALSIISSGVTQTGQPGPWIISIPSGSSWSMPCRMIECVCPPQTSIIAQGRVVTAWIWSSSRLARSGSLNSSRYFIAPAAPLLRRGHVQPGLPGGDGRTRRRTPPRASPSRSKLGERLLRRLLVEALDREADVHDDVLADRRRRGCTAGRPPCGPRRSRRRPSGCRRRSLRLSTRPGTARHMAVSPLVVPQRAPATRSWPSAIPPSFGGSSRGRSTLNPAPVRSPVRLAEQQRVLEHAAAERDRVESGVAADRCGQLGDQVDDRGVEAGGDLPGGPAAAHVVDDRAHHRRRVGDEGRRRRPRRSAKG